MLLIFDWDGTLCDSMEKIVNCLQIAARQVGLPVLDDAVIRNVIGLGLPEALEVLYPGLPEETGAILADAYSRWFVELDNIPSPLYDGVEETLTALRDSGFLLAVATSKSRRGLDRVLAKLGLAGFFHASRCADETASKPHPRMLQELLQQMRCPAAHAVLIGDTEYDLEMAQNAQMQSIAVTYGAHHVSRLVAYRPVMCLDYFPDLLPFVTASRASSPIFKHHKPQTSAELLAHQE